MRLLGPALLLVLLAGAPARAAGSPRDFEFARLNRTYRDVAGAVAPAEAGPFRVELSSPTQVLTLLRHRLRLTPRGDGTHDAGLWVQFQGRGTLVAQVSAGGLGRGFRDDVTLPSQAQSLLGRVRVARGKGGYLLTTLSLPPRVEVRIQSRLGAELLSWCRELEALPLSPVECGGVGRALAAAAVPLPRPGETYLLADADLSAADRRGLDEYLGLPTKGTGRPGRGARNKDSGTRRVHAVAFFGKVPRSRVSEPSPKEGVSPW